MIKLVELSRAKLSWKPNFQQKLTQIGISKNADISKNETVNESINLINNTPTNINKNNVENNQTQESPGYQLLKDKLKPIFLETVDIFHNKNIDERTYLTRVNKKIDDTLLKYVDDLSKEYLMLLDSPNY